MDGYVRVSKRMGREGPAYISPKVQREAIERWAAYRNVKIIAWHEDEDHSGGTQNRPGIREAIRRIEAGETEGLACWRLNRFARNVAGAIKDVERIHAAGGHLAFVEEDIDPTGQFGSFLLTILLAVATLERDNISSGWQIAKSKAVARGVRIGGALPGYEKGEDGVLIPSEPHVIQHAYELAGGSGIGQAMAYLQEKLPQRVWTASTTRRLLGSRVYLGEVNYGGMANTKAHKPLVSRRAWEAAQRPSEARRSADALYPLSGIVLCSGCHKPLVGSRAGATADKPGTRVYRCKSKCPSPVVVSADRLEAHARKVGRRMLLSMGLEERGDEPASKDVQRLESRLEETEAELYAFGSDLTARRAYGDRYHEFLEERVEARDVAKEALGEGARSSMTAMRALPVELIETSDPEELRELLSALFTLRTLEVTRGRGAIESRVRLVKRVDAPH